MHTHNMLTLWDISEWNTDNSNSWKGWSIHCPTHLDDEKTMLIAKLHGKSPVTRIAKDSRGWGKITGNYTVAQGYQAL